MQDFVDIISYLKELKEEAGTPKNIRNVIDSIVGCLDGQEDNSIKIDKCLNMLEEVSEDPNIQPYTRTQIWNLVSMLEKFNH